MSEIYPDEGLDFSMAIFPKNGANIATLYLGLFTSQTPTTVPARGALLANAGSDWTEVSGTGYARISLAAASWGAQGTSGSGRKSIYPQQTFTAGGAWTVANGFFIATTVDNTGKAICFANFDSGVARTLQVSGDTLKVTPAMEQDG
jgi:hypothetical protein